MNNQAGKFSVVGHSAACAMLVEPHDGASTPLLDAALAGETVLLVESDFAAAQALQAALECAGAEVLIARNAAEALPRLAQFDFSAALVEWRPDTREHRTLIRWLREDGVRFLYRAEADLEALAMGSAVPVLLKSAPQEEIVAALSGLAVAASVTAPVDAAI
jgi:DNA-binding response OmpR family regulator